MVKPAPYRPAAGAASIGNPVCRRITLALLVALVGGFGVGTPPSRAASRPVRTVRYLGLSLSVPAAWPIIVLARRPGACVRFDRHAVYLGRPGGTESCPATAIGRTEALLLQPATGARSLGPGISLQRGRVLITATWRSDPRTVRLALGLRRLPVPVARAAAAAPDLGRIAHTAAGTPGLGFDACATPSEATLRAWSASPYRTTGIYLGGANMACSQPNLTQRWVTDETAAGWHFIPTYVGLQAPGTSCGCSTINPKSAVGEAQAAAADAVARARSVGLGRGNPIYYDMEAYTPGLSATRTVLTFLSAWTTALHAAGYVSGVYSSAASGISDLGRALGDRQYDLPDDLWIADWNGRRTTSDPYLPSADWATHQRIHQYDGGENETYGRVTLNVDGDYIDGATAQGGAILQSATTIPDGAFVSTTGGALAYRVVGGAPLPVTNWTPFGGPQPVRPLTAAQFATLNPVPTNGTYVATPSGSLYRVAGGALLPILDQNLLGGAPPALTIDPADVSLAGSAGSHLNAIPAVGTVVQGLPSGRLWTFTRTGRYATAASAAAAAIPVQDASLAAYPVVPAPVLCIVPQLHRLSLAAARTALARAHCTVGVIHRPTSVLGGHLLRVHAQRPSAGSQRSAGHTVNLALL